MENGRYIDNAPWSDFRVPNALNALTRNASLGRRILSMGCGSNALLTILGYPYYEEIVKREPKCGYWNDRPMTRFLTKRGFKVFPVTKYGVTSTSQYYTATTILCDSARKIQSDHVLLCNLLLCKNEASWFVVTQNKAFHNFDEMPVNPLFWVNFPSQSIYLITCNDWQQAPIKKAPAKRRLHS